MGNSIGKEEYKLGMVDTNAGIDTKSGFRSEKAKHDGLRGVPPKINKKQEIVCKDQDEVDYIENMHGQVHKYKAVLDKSVDQEPEEGDDN